MADAKSILVYSAVWCPFCHAAMEYLDKKGISYEERDVEKKQVWMQEALDKSGQTGIPVLDINGQIIVGFDRPKIDAALAA